MATASRQGYAPCLPLLRCPHRRSDLGYMDWNAILKDIYVAFGMLGPAPEALVSSLDETQPFAPAVGDQLLVELALVEVTYDFIASRSYCIRCGSPLGVNLRVEVQPTQGGDTWSHVRVSSRCRSWRRHLHTALVARTTDGLELGQFNI